MRILHIDVTGPYTENMNYQGNMLSKQNAIDGHEVYYIATCAAYHEGMVVSVSSGRTVNSDGVFIIRVPLTRYVFGYISNKIRNVSCIKELLNEIRPDVILFHGTTAYSIIAVSEYKKNNPHIRFYVDCHEAYYNSAKNFLSKHVLHRIIYKNWFHKALPFVDKVLYVGEGEREYLIDMMNLEEHQFEFYPIGGLIVSKDEKIALRIKIRKELKLSDNQVFLLHSGKLDKLKRTSELINAFSSILDDRLRLVIIGSIPNDQEDILLSLIDKDPRIIYLGWKPADLLSNYLAASDLYLQPGSVSATLQNAICSGTPVMIYPHKCYDVYVRENGFRVVSEEDMRSVFERVSLDSSCLNEMSKASFKYACEFLDYKKLAARLYQ